jgi:fatty-acyl-CoA synthase
MDASILDLRTHAAAAPDRVAISCGNERLTYAELESLSNRLASVLRSRGLVRGDHVASLVGNRPEALALAWATWRTGLYLTPMPTTSSASELAYLIENCDAKAVFVDAEVADAAQALSVPDGVHRLALRGAIAGCVDLRDELARASALPQPIEPPGSLMMYTSGTTGAPKGVHRPLLPSNWRGTPPFAADLIELFGLGGEDVRYLSTAPLYHAAPLRCALTVTAGGGTVYVMSEFDAEAALTLIERERITHSQWVPAMFQRLLALPTERRAAHRAPAHRTAIHGAAPCQPAVKRVMIDWWGPILLEYFSGSEGIGLTLIASDEALERPGSVGRARKGTLHIVDDSGAELPAWATGLICFSGVAPFSYYKAPEKTAQRTLAKGWQTFGDVGHIDHDGYLYLTDRLDDMIISGGVNLYPQEIEAALRDVPGVWEVAVVGIDDARFGERPIAFVVPDRSAPCLPKDLRGALQRRAEERLGRLKRPDAFHLIDALPRSATGKLLRRRLRDLIPTSKELTA